MAARASATSAALRPAVPAGVGVAPPAARTVTAGPPAPGVSATVTCPLGERYGKLTSSVPPSRAAESASATSRTSMRICASVSGSLVRARVVPLATSAAGLPTTSWSASARCSYRT